MSNHSNTEYINEEIIRRTLEQAKKATKKDVRAIVEKSYNFQGLELEEVAVLLQIEDDTLLEQLFDAAKFVKNKIYGKRVVLFAPLYSSNECTNNCEYCGFRVNNKQLDRKTLSIDEIVDQAKAIVDQGHKRILLLCGEEPNKADAKHLVDAMDAIYKNTDTRRINIEAAPMSVADYKLIKEAGIGTYVIFQETYDRKLYKKMHPSGLKSDFDWRITALDRAFEAGIDDVGLGTLLGLGDYKFDVLGLLMHAQGLEKKYGVGAHTISVPRLRPAVGWGLKEVPNPVSDADFKKIVAIYRIAVPYTGIILSTRESECLRDELLNLGVSQFSAGSKTSPGGYGQKTKANQFEISDHRPLPSVLEAICENGYIPSFCTACYRRCRTGESFMEHAKSGDIQDFCQPNAILTFKENILDFGSDYLRQRGNQIIDKAIEEIKDDGLKNMTIQKLKQIEEGKRDLYF